MTNPMEDLRLLMQRVADEVMDLNVRLVQFVAIPAQSGTDHISCTFEVLPEAVKSTDEIKHDRLQDDFFSILGDMTAEVDEEGNVLIGGGADAPDEESEQDRQERVRIREERVSRILREYLEGDGDDE